MADPIRTRAELLQNLTVACELEQGLGLQYLFAAFSLKDSVSEGLTARELTYVRKWKANIFLVAAQEMLHLTQAGNLCLAVGGTVELARPNFPQAPWYYPTGLPWALTPFSRETVRRFACYERPEHLTVHERVDLGHCRFSPEDEAAIFHTTAQKMAAKQPMRDLPDALAARRPRAIQHETVGELYAAIEQAFQELEPIGGELIIGDPAAQVSGSQVDFPQIIEVRSRQLGVEAGRLIVRQGEGAPDDRVDSHFGIFVGILDDYDMLKAERPEFEPARPVHANPLSSIHVDNTYPGYRLIDDPFTRQVNDLDNALYETMLLLLYRFFASGDAPDAVRLKLSRSAIRIMTTVLKPLGEALTQLPMGGDDPDRPTNAGPSFELDRSIQLTPYGGPAWLVIYERLVGESRWAAELAESRAAAEPDHRVAIPYLRQASAILHQIAESLGASP